MQIPVRYNGGICLGEPRDAKRRWETETEREREREGEAWMQTKLVCEKMKMWR